MHATHQREEQHEAPTGDTSLVWDAAIPLLTSRFAWWDVLLVALIAGAAFDVLLIGMLLASGQDVALSALPLVLGGPIAAALGLMLGGQLLTALIFLDRYVVHFTVDRDGVTAAAGRRVRTVHRLALVASALSSRPLAAAPAVGAMAGETKALAWADIRRVVVHRSARVISLSNSWRVVVRLYCPEDRFAEILARVREYADAHQALTIRPSSAHLAAVGSARVRNTE